MDLAKTVYFEGLAKPFVAAGSTIHPLIIPADQTNGTGLMNPSVYVDEGRLLVNIRHVNYTLYHSENKKFQHAFGPLQYLNPENDVKLRTWNYLCELNDDITIKKFQKIDTSQHDQEPLWDFIGLEDARLFRWDDRLFLCGVRRDTTTNGQGRMELSEIKDGREIDRVRLPAPGANDSYCEKNWMPVLDQPFTWVKWTNPTEIVRYYRTNHVTFTQHLDAKTYVPNLPDFRGSSQVVPYGDYYIAVTHEVNLIRPIVGEKDATYRHRFIVWDRDWNLVKYTEPFSFMNADIEFCCGLALYQDHWLISFGFQDNAAFILRVPEDLLLKFLDIQPLSKSASIQQKHNIEFDWGLIQKNAWFHNQVRKEVFDNDDYQRFFSVDPGDVVLDIGASVGPFAWKVDSQQASRIICVEPDVRLFETLEKNFKALNTPVEAVNCAVYSADGHNSVTGLFDPDRIDTNEDTATLVATKTWKTLLQEHKIERIDFLKMDAEGAEYDVFTDQTIDWIQRNVKKMAMEIHLATPKQKQKFRWFRDQYLKRFSKIHVLDLAYVDIKKDLWTDEFINFYETILIYIDNRRPTIELKNYQKYPAPTLEITTAIPEKGCVVDCVFCPQRVLEKKYTGDRILTMDNFRRVVDKIPQEVRITFAGFTEPWLNKYCTDMVLYAHEAGHPVSVFTTAVGMSVEDCERLVDIPYAGNPNGGFCLHLPDSERLAKHPITPGFVKTVEWFRDNHHRIRNFYTMCMGGEVHESVSHCFPTAPSFAMYGRANNLAKEMVLKPELIGVKNRWQAVYHADAKRTCGCVEHLYHNVLLPNGDVSLCCMDYDLEHIIGNLFEQEYEHVIPKEQQTYRLCTFCENGVKPQ